MWSFHYSAGKRDTGGVARKGGRDSWGGGTHTTQPCPGKCIGWGSSDRGLEWERTQPIFSHCSGVGAEGYAEVLYGWQDGPPVSTVTAEPTGSLIHLMS